MDTSEVAFALLQPSNAVLVLIVAGLALSLVQRWAGLAVTVGGVALLALLGLSPLGEAMLRPLEAAYPADPPTGPPTAIIVLGGFLAPGIAPAPYDLPLTEQAERVTMAVVLSRRWPEAKVVVTEGVMAEGLEAGAAVGGRALEGIGVPADRLVLETRARSTRDNAVFTRELIDPQPGQTFVLVTSAWHMPRSVATFRAAGWTGIVPYPVDYFTTEAPLALSFPGSVSRGLSRVDIATREIVATLVYDWRGWLDAPDGSGAADPLDPAGAGAGTGES